MRKIAGGLAILLIASAGVYAVPALRDRAVSWLPSSVVSWLPSSFVGKGASPAGKRGANLRPLPVKVGVAVKSTVPIYLEGVGTVKARSTVDIKSRIEGLILEAPVREGQTVGKGDVLFRLDPRPLQAKLKEARALLARARANHAKAVVDVRRLSGLSAKGYSPQTQVENAKTLVDTLDATVRASEAELELAQLNLDYATIRSPIKGRLGKILITPGNVVKANDTQPLLIITETKPVYVSFGIPEQHIDEIRARMASDALPVAVSTQSSQTVATGRLFFINNQVDTATGTIELLAQFANDDERLVPGQFIRARILLSTIKDAVLVQNRAVQINQSGHYLWVVSADNTVELRSVVTGPDSGDKVTILEGLAAGEKIVTDGQLRLFLGAKVAVGGGKAPAGKAPGGDGKPKSQKESQKGRPAT